MKVLDFIYNETTISFEPTGNDDVMVNATEMAKVFGKDVFDFMKNDSTKNFISVALKTENSRFLGIENESDLIISKQKSGTWMHRILALKFAAWLDPAFELWVYVTIDKIILGHYKEQRDATIEKIKAEAAAEAKKFELLGKYPEFAEFLELEGKITEADKKRVKAIRASTDQLKFDLFGDK